MTDPGSDQLMLLCRGRRLLCALPLGALVETMRPLPLTPIGGAPAFVRGVCLIRGTPTPVVDLGALLESPDPPAPMRFVTLKVAERRVALAVEEVLGFRRLGAALALPPLLGGVGSDAVAALGRLDAELLLVLEASRLVPEEVFSLAHGESPA